MHREYHPDDMEHLQAHAFEDVGSTHHDDDHRREHQWLYGFTITLGVLIAVDLLLGAIAPSGWQALFGLRPVWIAAVIGAARIIYQALEAITRGSVGADVALAIAAVAALLLREPFVAAEVVFIALVGEVLEAITADRALKSIRRLFDQSPKVARVRRDGQLVEVRPHEVELGEIVVVAPGDRVPVDGPIILGRTTLDQSAITGESIPVDRGPGESVYTGTINLFGQIEVEAERVGHESTFGQVLQLVANAQRQKAPLQKTADLLARRFLPVVLGTALFTFIVGLLLGWPDAGERAVAVLVVACPCALILATPAAVMASMAWLARHGLVIKSGLALERLAKCDVIAFDKTGTLTIGRPELVTLKPLDGRLEEELLALAASVEQGGRHPLAEAITKAAESRSLKWGPVVEVTVQPGAGVEGIIEAPDSHNRRTVLVGNQRLLQEREITWNSDVEDLIAALDDDGQTILMVAEDGQLVGLLGVRDTLRPEAHDVIHDLKHLRFHELALLTGDRRSVAESIAQRVHLKVVEAEQLPADKAAWVASRQEQGHRVVMVGDGINDAPALATADVGIALGGAGADLAAEAGDVVLLGDPLRVLPDFVKLSRATVRVIRQNIIGFAFGLNGIAIALAFFGVLGPVPAAILHQAGSLLVLLNAMRLLAFGDWREAAPFRYTARVGRRIREWEDRLDLGQTVGRLQIRWRAGLLVLGIIGLLGYFITGIRTIGPSEIGLLQYFGRFETTLEPGLHWSWPQPIGRVTIVEPDQVRSLTLGFRSTGSMNDATISWESLHRREAPGGVLAMDEALVMTADNRLVELTATIQYRPGRTVRDWKTFAFGVDEPVQGLQGIAEATVRSIVAQQSLDSLLTKGRRLFESAVLEELRHRITNPPLGLDVLEVNLGDVHPPLEVVDAYRDVSRADRDRLARTNEAQAYRAERLANAGGVAAELKAKAEAIRHGTTSVAAARAAAFRSLIEARATSVDLTDDRLYQQTIEASFSGRSKLILDRVDPMARRHLILGTGVDPVGLPQPMIDTTRLGPAQGQTSQISQGTPNREE